MIFRDLKSFEEVGLSHELIRMQHAQHEQKRTMKLNQICKYLEANTTATQTKKPSKPQSRFESSLIELSQSIQERVIKTASGSQTRQRIITAGSP